MQPVWPGMRNAARRIGSRIADPIRYDGLSGLGRIGRSHLRVFPAAPDAHPRGSHAEKKGLNGPRQGTIRQSLS